MTTRSKFTPHVAETILAALRAGKSLAHAAGAAGISRDTLQRWVRNGQRDDAPDELSRFAEDVKAAQEAKVPLPYEYDLTEAARIIILVEEGWELRKAVAIVGGPALSTVHNWIQRGRVRGAPADLAAFSERYERAVAHRDLQKVLAYIDEVEERWGRDEGPEDS